MKISLCLNNKECFKKYWTAYKQWKVIPHWQILYLASAFWFTDSAS